MKKLFIPLLFAFLFPVSFSCSSMRFGSYNLTEADAAAAIREMLSLGAKESNLSGAFSKEAVMATLFPESMRKTLNTLNQLGLTGEIDRFTTTLGTAAEKTATASVPIFISGINNMKFTDAMRIIKNGGTSATDYLRSSVGDSLRRAITPAMKTALQEYKLNEQWEKIIKPAQVLVGNKLNLDLANLMAGMVSEKMFQQLEAKEKEVRTTSSARTTTLLQKVFSKKWQ
ncbi:DUF4197 domain-containing protein [Flavisolibacter ginsengisoli]|jgi:hypothetical protein|uniref:DUF4197 domain-containing protein n=1 Tax=Flavisolibacter ginsengisoli DSM 18119 TaxID=1121884 RepID=A0A1M4ZVE2_9BACT|nr:DUF4197 domain-containing protein [Flavisolibacter ginsengisoli]SHF22050.1 Protein of unknown function [Flavisolibacter ginsengisoli DSM 18119]